MRAIIISSSDYSKVFNLVTTLYNVTIIRVYHKSPKILNSRNRPFSIIYHRGPQGPPKHSVGDKMRRGE